MATHYLACDLGAESGRLMLGTLADGKLVLEELHRFQNTPVRNGNSLQWDIPKLFGELVAGLKKAAAQGLKFSGISTDSWGVDYILFDAEGKLMEPVFHYRDPRTAIGVERVKNRLSWPDIFAESGIQFMALNTLFQLGAEEPERLQKARFLLGVGDAFNYLLGGRPAVERSMASTFQTYSPIRHEWAPRLLQAGGIPPALMPEIASSGTVLGTLSKSLQTETGLDAIPVIATCSHDTGAAVAAIPAADKEWAYLSSGTWSLLGLELAQPVITDQARAYNFTNEIGHQQSVRLLKNIAGLWLVQECRRHWASQGQDYDYQALTELATRDGPARSLINPADERFVSMGDMPDRIQQFCVETGQPVPAGPGETIRLILESLALIYRRTLMQADELAGRKSRVLHVVGGGCRNDLLNQLTADAIQIPVIAGPVEATAAGNVLIQAMATKDLGSWAEARACVAQSFGTRTFQPGKEPIEAIARFERLCAAGKPTGG